MRKRESKVGKLLGRNRRDETRRERENKPRPRLCRELQKFVRERGVWGERK